MNDDLDAIRRVLAADVESFRRLVERYQRPLLTLVRNLTPPETDHEGGTETGTRDGNRDAISFSDLATLRDETGTETGTRLVLPTWRHLGTETRTRLVLPTWRHL